MDETASEPFSGRTERQQLIRNYNFSQPKLINKEVLRLIREIHELYQRHLKRIYSNLLGESVNITLSATEQVNFSAYLSEIKQLSTLYTFNIEELGDWAVLELDTSLCIYYVEKQSGGYGDLNFELRTITRIEEKIIDRLAGRMLKELSHVWSSYLPFTIQHHLYEPKPDSIRTVSAHSNGILMHFIIEFGGEKRSLAICYPYSLIKSKMMNDAMHLDMRSLSEPMKAGDQKLLEEDIKRVKIDLKVLLGTAKIPLQKLIDLKEDDTLMLDQPIEEPLKIQLGNRIKMTGYPGSLNGKRAIKIFNIVKNEMHQFDF